MRTGVFGGSFNPPHIGHLIIADWMREEFNLDRILWMPAARSPFKIDGPMAHATQRLEMVRCAVQGNPHFDVSDVEVRRGDVSYTIDTLRHLRGTLPGTVPGDELFLLMGSDSLAAFPEWREAAEIAKLAPLLVFRRPGETETLPAEWLRPLVRFAEAPRLEISATAIRDRCRRRLSIRYLVPDAVRAYIEKHDLYVDNASR